MYHNPVLLHKSIEGLDIKPDGIYVDVTFGGGGHSMAILEQLLFQWLQLVDKLFLFKLTHGGKLLLEQFLDRWERLQLLQFCLELLCLLLQK